MIIGITGKSGSGKTTISEHIAKKFNYKHENIDTIFHTLIETEFVGSTAELFGWEVFDKDISDGYKLVNRKIIGDKIFNNRHDEKYISYNEMLYNGLLVYLDKVFSFCPNVILDHILLPHMPKLWSMCDIKILVTNKYFTIRKKRVIERDSITEEYFDLREKSSIDYNYSDFDYVIQNNYDNNFIVERK